MINVNFEKNLEEASDSNDSIDTFSINLSNKCHVHNEY